MRRILICTGVLGGGTALVFALAAVTAVLIPPSRIVPQDQNIVLLNRSGPIRGWVGPADAVTIVGGGADVFVELATPEESR